jgi:hypothetical protein
LITKLKVKKEMSQLSRTLVIFLTVSLALSSCSSDNECDNSCQTGQVQLLNCMCAQDANDIVPHPCPDMTCPSGQALVVMGGTCSCEMLAPDDPCANVTCPEGFICDGGACITDPNSLQEIPVEGNITADVTWESGNVYVLTTRVTVTPGVTLTIEPGVVVKGQAGTGANASALLIARGATLIADGTSNAPIIMSSIADEILPGQIASPNLEPDVTGLWGGLIILGNAPISASTNEVQIEGIPTSDSNGLYGGNDPMDNSGILRYVSVRHGGTNIGEGNEINGITFGGVGAGTTVEYVEVVGTQDDGLEFFGGTVNVTNAIVWNNGDDAFDTDQAWSGTLDNAITVNPGDSPLELDGPEGDFMSSGHTISNLTSFGAASGKELFDVDANTDINMSNLLFYGFAADAIVSSDYADYAANMNGYSVTNVEAIFTNGGDAASVFGDAAGLVTTLENLNQAKGGAVASEFTSWSWAGMTDLIGDLVNAQSNPEARIVDLPATIDTDLTLTSGDVYVLTTRTTVTSGATLTIEPGVILKGVAGTGAAASSLLIARGAKLNAMGTASAPIIMTSIADEILPGQINSPNLAPDVSGLWGGLIILGNAPISASAQSVQIEGIPTSDANGLYGGTDPMDDSGTIRYVSVRHGGTNIGEGNEINGITFGGVGAGTTVEYVEVLGTQDDGLEFFGGSVNVTNALVWNNGDDAFDTDQAWSGTLDNAITVNPGDSPLELDGPEGDFTSTGHTITNLTSYGAAAGKELFDVDATTDINMSNLYFFGFASDAKVSSDYAEYAANMNGYAIMNVEATFDNGGDIASVFGDAADLVVAVGSGMNTVGADVSQFGWTSASQSGALASIGLE